MYAAPASASGGTAAGSIPASTPFSLWMLAVTHAIAALQILRSIDLKLWLNWYINQLETRPLVTKCISSGSISFVGDALAQWFEAKMHKKDLHYSYRRAIAMFLDGLLISGPLMHFGYDLFETIIPISSTSSKLIPNKSIAAILHVIADSVFLDSIFVGTEMVSSCFWEDDNFKDEIIPLMKQNYFPTYRASVATATAFAPLEFVFFRFLPLHFRQLAVNCTDIIWSAIVSFMVHRGRDGIISSEEYEAEVEDIIS